MIPGSTMPLPTVAATFRWKMKYAMKLKTAAIPTATCGFNTPVDTTVAIELAASCSPFMKSKASASTTRNTRTPSVIVIGLIAVTPSSVLERDAFGEVRHVEAAVRDRLEQLVDRLHLDHLAHVLLFAEKTRDGRAHHAIGIGFQAVDLVARLDDRLELALLAAEERDHVLHPLAALHADVREALALGGHGLHVVERERFAGVLDEVADVVHGVHELVDVVAVQRGDERGMQEADRLGRDAVGRVLGVVDDPGVLLALVVLLHEHLELMRGAHDLARVGVEQLEKAAFLGEQSAEHGVA